MQQIDLPKAWVYNMPLFMPEFVLRNYLLNIQNNIYNSLLNDGSTASSTITQNINSVVTTLQLTSVGKGTYLNDPINGLMWNLIPGVVNSSKNILQLKLYNQVVFVSSESTTFQDLINSINASAVATSLITTTMSAGTATDIISSTIRNTIYKVFTGGRDNYITEMFGAVGSSGDFNPLIEAQAIFSSSNNPVKVKIGINIATADLPAAHIYLPRTDTNFQGIGNSPNYFVDDNLQIEEEDETYNHAVYSIMIVGDNSDKVVLIHSVLYFMLLKNISNLESDGFMNTKLSANDLITEQNLIPSTIYARNISLSFDYSLTSINMMMQPQGSSLIIDKPNLDIKNP